MAALFRVGGRRLLPVTLRDGALVVAPMLEEASHRHVAGADSLLSDVTSGKLGGGCRVIAPEAARTRLLNADPSGYVHLVDLPVWVAPDTHVLSLLTNDRALLVDLAAVEIRLEAVRGIDPSQGMATLTAHLHEDQLTIFDDSLAASWFRIWHVGVFAELLGCAEQALDLSIEHATQREQFGRPIAGFQAVAHMLADMKAGVELAISALANLVVLVEDNGEGLDDLIDVMRWFVPGIAREVCETAIQVHGGVGFTWEYGLHLFYRRALETQAGLGGPVQSAKRLGLRLLDRQS